MNAPSDPKLRRFALQLCAAVALLILYGSWFPFRWIRPDPEDVMWALTDTTLWTGRADLLGNVALFMPWGVAAALAARAQGRSATAWSLGGGLALAALAQAGQFFEAHRDPRWADMVWNGVGAALGLGLAPLLPRLRGRAGQVLLAGSALVAWLPLWPTLDPHRLQAHWRVLGQLGPWQGPEAAMMAGLTLIAGAAAAARWRRAPRRAVVLAGAALLAGQLLVPGTRLSGGGALGLALGAVAALALHRSPRGVAGMLTALQVVGGLAPFDVGGPVQAVHWLPFEASLRGGMLGNAQALARDLWLWGGALWFARCGGWPLGPTTGAMALLALAVEAVQTAMPSRTADVTPALIVLAAGAGLARWRTMTALVELVARAAPPQGR